MTDGLPLEQLYALVPAAEEEDLLDELEAEREQAVVDPDELPLSGAPTGEPPSEPEEPDEPVPTHWQALGVVQHHLGGTVLPPEDDPA